MGEYLMAWPKLRNRGSQVTFSKRNGAAPDGTQSGAAAPDSAARQGAARGGTANGSAAASRPAASSSPAASSVTAANGGPADGGAADSSPVSGSAASGSAAADGAASAGAPLAWPAGDAAGPSPADAPEAAETADVEFWDWGSSEDQPGSPRDGPAQEGATVRARSGRLTEPVVTPVVTADDEPQREGIGQHLGNLAHLSANPRIRVWQWRAILAIVVGVVFTIWISWRLGLTLAVLAVIADTVYRSRASYAGPGEAAMTGPQRRTRRKLARLERAGYRAMHCRPIPDSEDQIDHLVVGPAGVFSIDSEAWDRRMPVRFSNHRDLWYGPVSQKGRLEHSRLKSERAAELISRALGSPVTVHPALAVYGAKIHWEVITIRDTDVYSGPRLRKYLRRQARQARRKGQGLLSASEVERIDKAAHVAFPDPAD